MGFKERWQHSLKRFVPERASLSTYRRTAITVRSQCLFSVHNDNGECGFIAGTNTSAELRFFTFVRLCKHSWGQVQLHNTT
jgi:hypothetical protein